MGQRRANGLPLTPTTLEVVMLTHSTTCSIDGCERPFLARGWCALHYRRGMKFGNPLATHKPKPSVEEQFWARVDTSGGAEACWPATAPGKYGTVTVNGADVKAHRYSYTLAYGPIPDGLDICHKCDNPPCVNPKHLFAGTNKDNMHDRAIKGRNSNRKGVANGRAKLSEADVRLIRADSDPSPATARRFGVAKSTVVRIRNGRLWGSL